MIEVDSLTSGYVPGINILNEISVTFKEEEITGIIGPNGAGKSTLLKTMYGFLRPTEGTIELNGEDITQYSPREMLSKVGLAYIPQERSVFPEMTVQENLELGAWTIRRDSERVHDAIDDIFSEFPALKDKRRDRASTLSGGQQRMLEIGRSLITDPEVVFIDEPSVGLAPNLVTNVYDSIRQLRDVGVTVVLVDQNINAAVEHSDEIVVLQDGQVVEKGSTDELGDEIKSLVSRWVSSREVI